MNTVSHRSPSSHKGWMKFSAVVVIAFGPLFLLGAHPATAGATRFMTDILGWTFPGGQSFDAPTTRFVAAMAGGFLVGWGVVLWRLATTLHDVAPEAVRRAAVTGFVTWYVTDSAASIASGHPSNVAFNTFFLLLCVGPLWWPATAEPVPA